MVIVGLGLMIWKLLEAKKLEAEPGYDSQQNLIKRLPNSVQQAIASMSPQQFALFLSDYRPKRNSTSVAYLVWFFCGLHYAYTRQWLLQVIFWFTGGGFGIWWLIDLFRMPSIVRTANGDIARQVLSDMTVAQGFAANAAAPQPLLQAAPAVAPEFDTELGAWTITDPVQGKLIHDTETDTWRPL